MSVLEVDFREFSARPRTESLPLSHLSIELGHLYMEDFRAGPRRLKELFTQVAPWAAAARQVCEQAVRPKRARVSTCFLVDDYFSQFSTPAEVIPMVLKAAAEVELSIDYLSRESACAEADGVPLAKLVEGRLVAEPPTGTTGARPPVSETGWLCNGERSPGPAAPEAMSTLRQWRPPRQNAVSNHSIFIDVELWDEQHGTRRWSCPMLAAVWQLLRLGLLRDSGRVVAVPQPPAGSLPDLWSELPPTLQLNPTADPFAAYRTYSALNSRFLPIENAVRTILSQVAVQDEVNLQVLKRAFGEHLELPAEVVDRIDYAFVGASWRRISAPASPPATDR